MSASARSARAREPFAAVAISERAGRALQPVKAQRDARGQSEKRQRTCVIAAPTAAGACERTAASGAADRRGRSEPWPPKPEEGERGRAGVWAAGGGWERVHAPAQAAINGRRLQQRARGAQHMRTGTPMSRKCA